MRGQPGEEFEGPSEGLVPATSRTCGEFHDLCSCPPLTGQARVRKRGVASRVARELRRRLGGIYGSAAASREVEAALEALRSLSNPPRAERRVVVFTGSTFPGEPRLVQSPFSGVESGRGTHWLGRATCDFLTRQSTRFLATTGVGGDTRRNRPLIATGELRVCSFCEGLRGGKTGPGLHSKRNLVSKRHRSTTSCCDWALDRIAQAVWTSPHA